MRHIINLFGVMLTDFQPPFESQRPLGVKGGYKHRRKHRTKNRKSKKRGKSKR